MTVSLSENEIFSSVDAALLHIDTPTNLGVITGVITFDIALDFDRLKATIENRLLVHRRFRQRVIEAKHLSILPVWMLDPNFMLDAHLFRISLPVPGDDIALQKYIGDQMSKPLDPTKPLWQFQYVDNYYQRSALIFRVHHCIADGLALVKLLLSIADEAPDSPWPERVDTEDKETQLSPLTVLLRPAVKAAMYSRQTWRNAVNLTREGLVMLSNPSSLIETTTWVKNAALALGKLLFLPPDKKTLLRSPIGKTKKVTWSTGINLDEIKTIGSRLGGTVNDILLSAITGALRRYLEEHDENVVGLNIRAVIPVSLRHPDDVELLSNRFGLVFLSLPIGMRDPIKRMMILKSRMNGIKKSPESIVAFGIINATGFTPQLFRDTIVKIFGMKGSTVVTNVPGPPKPLFFAGGKIDTIMFWVPTPGNLSLGISIISYSERVFIGISADESVIPDPKAILRNFQHEFEYLKVWSLLPH